MLTLLRRSLFVAASISLFSLSATAEPIKIDLKGSTLSGPDIELVSGVLSTRDDGDLTSPGDQATRLIFGGDALFAEDLVTGEFGSFSLEGVSLVGTPFVLNQGAFGSVTQPTTGGTFDLFDPDGAPLLSGTIENGLLTGSTNGATSGGFFNLNFGAFTGPAESALFDLLDATKASLSISLTGIASPSSSGFSIVDNALQDFTADATANIDAEGLSGILPEPATLGLATLALIGALGYRRRRV